MPGLMFAHLAVSEELKETDRHTDGIALCILDARSNDVTIIGRYDCNSGICLFAMTSERYRCEQYSLYLSFIQQH